MIKNTFFRMKKNKLGLSKSKLRVPENELLRDGLNSSNRCLLYSGLVETNNFLFVNSIPIAFFLWNIWGHLIGFFDKMLLFCLCTFNFVFTDKKHLVFFYKEIICYYLYKVTKKQKRAIYFHQLLKLKKTKLG